MKWREAKDIVHSAGQVLFPLDEELLLLPGKYTPQLQETMTRLGSKMPFAQAAEEVWCSRKTRVTEANVRGLTHRYGAIAEAVVKAEVARLEKEMPASTATPKQLLVSSDGAFIHLTNGEWREVKTMVLGEIEQQWHYKKGEVIVKTKDLSYFSRSYDIRDFERYALAELHRRGVDNATEVVTINDGAHWIQSLIDYHFPKATRILDFAHALSYLAVAGKAVLGEETVDFAAWLAQRAHQLKHDPPRQIFLHLALLCRQAQSDEQLALIDHARRYLQKRAAMIDYRHFRLRGLPIGSGSVESSHKIVVHSRFKQAGMRWAPAHVDPLLTLRNLICNDRWQQGWSQIVAFYWQQRHQKAQQKAASPVSIPITFAAVKVTPEEPTASPPTSLSLPHPNRPAPDHPWRHGIWPSQEASRWH